MTRREPDVARKLARRRESRKAARRQLLRGERTTARLLSRTYVAGSIAKLVAAAAAAARVCRAESCFCLHELRASSAALRRLAQLCFAAPRLLRRRRLLRKK